VATRYRVAVIGYGRIAETGHTEALTSMSAFEVVGVCDVVESRVLAAQKRFPGCHAYSSLESMLRQEHPDLVVICSPPVFHFGQIVTSLEHGCHVVCEKPLLLATGQYATVRRLAEEAGKIVYPCHTYKFAPAIIRAKQLLTTEGIGRPKHILLTTVRQSHRMGVIDWQPNWRRDKTVSGGGILVDHGVHSVYLSMYFTGSRPVEIAGILHKDPKSEWTTEDTASLSLRFPESLAQIYMTWSGSRRYASYVVEGEHGSITIDDSCLVARKSSGECVSETTRLTAFDDPGHGIWYGAFYTDVLRRIDQSLSSYELLAEAEVATEITQELYARARGRLDLA
jgi:predicted dehydrogenase